MLIPKEKIDEAKRLYDGQAIQEIIDYFNVDNYNGRNKSCSCPFHHDNTPSFIWNEKTNCFHCFSCNRNFGIIDLYLEKGMTYLEAVQTLFEKTNISYSFSNKGLQSKSTYKYPKREYNDRIKAEEYLNTRCISKKTMDYADVQSDINGNITFHYYDANDVLLSVKYRPSCRITKESKLIKNWYQKDADNTPVLFNMNRIDPSKPLVITEGEIDTLSIIESGYTNVVSVPGGAQNMRWIEECWDWLEQFDKIIIWSDNDTPGLKMRNEVTRRLGTWRTYYIEITDANTYFTKNTVLCKDANEVLICYGKNKILEYINHPLEMPIEGVFDLSESEDFDIESAEGLYTKIEDLDNKIYKLVFGTLNIITGKSGEGKSVFVNQIAICQALQQGYDVFVFSGELPAPVLKNWVETNMIGRDKIEMNKHIRKFDPKARTEMRKWYKGRVMMYDDSIDTTSKSIMNKMEEMARKFGTKVFLIDNLMMVDLECTEEGRLQAEKEFIKDLILFAKKFEVLVFLVAHPRKTGETMLNKEDISGSSNIVNLAHMVFSVHRYTDNELEGQQNIKGNGYVKGKEPKTFDSCVSVLKNRITGLLPTTELYFDYNSYRFYRTPKELWFRYGWNTDTSPLNTNDPNPHGRVEETPFNEDK